MDTSLERRWHPVDRGTRLLLRRPNGKSAGAYYFSDEPTDHGNGEWCNTLIQSFERVASLHALNGLGQDVPSVDALVKDE
jgi:hypothetical protein